MIFTQMIFNLTQHEPTGSQIESVASRTEEQASAVKSLLNFIEPPSREEIVSKAAALADIAKAAGATAAMIGGAPYLMGPLEKELRYRRIIPVYSFSKRVSKEEVVINGTVQKTSVFEHVEWVEGTQI